MGHYQWWHTKEDEERIDIKSAEFRPTFKLSLKQYAKLMVISTIMLWTPLSIFFGCVHKRSAYARNIELWVIDLDGGEMGSNITNELVNLIPDDTSPTWIPHDTNGFSTVDEAVDLVRRKGWGALVINPGLTERLSNALYKGAEYDPTDSITIIPSSGRQIAVEMLFVQNPLHQAASTIAFEFSHNLLKQFKKTPPDEISQTQPNYKALFTPIIPVTRDAAPAAFSAGPVIVLFGFLLSFLCTLAPLIMWKMQQFPFFLKVKLRDLSLMWLVLIVCWDLLFTFYYALAVLAFKGEHFNRDRLALEFTAASFFKIWFTASIVIIACAFWIASWFMYLPPSLLAFPSLVTVIPNVVSCVNPPQLSSKFFRFEYALPFHNGYELIQYIMTGAYPHIGRCVGVLVAETVVMGTILAVSIWIRQGFVLAGLSDLPGWYRGNTYFHQMVPYYKDSKRPDIEKPEPLRSKESEEDGDEEDKYPKPKGSKSPLLHEETDSVQIQDTYDDTVSLKTGNFGV